MTVAAARGVELFARYAHAPNQLGYCGPPGSDALAEGREAQVRSAAKRFSGAWPYLQVLARLTGTEDPLDERLVQAYWLGGDLGVDAETIGPGRFGAELLAVIGPQAGHYWTHLTPELLAQATGDHCFHVFGVYPWTRLLGRGVDEHPMHVLDSCRIRWGTVLAREGAGITVSSRRLSWDGAALGLAPETVGQLPVAVDGVSFLPDVAPGDLVAVHWDRLCDRLTPEQVADLEASTLRELAATNLRLGAP